jgi:3-phosphoshikimate 1-carboxyvinyltransferase
MPALPKIIVPGDKSITHRALFLASLTRGESVLHHALSSLDTRATARVLRRLGVEIGVIRQGLPVRVAGRARFRSARSAEALDCANSGTTARLLLGLLASHPGAVRLTGDQSLRRRPMRRVTEPLSEMGARFDPPLADRLPLTIHGGPLRPIRWPLPVSSAQLKSAVLLAGLSGGVPVAVREPAGVSRDHTERMLRALGVPIATRDGWIELEPVGRLPAFEATIPGDPSSAAFLVGAALIGGRTVAIDGVGLNPTRLGFVEVLTRMGASIEATVVRHHLGEPAGPLSVHPGRLVATRVRAAEIPGLIDEIPTLAVVAARAEGTTVFDQVGELRVKESDRLALLAENLRALGYRARGEDNVLVVTGSDHPPVGRIRTDGDHRIAMAFAGLRLVKGAEITIDSPGCVAVSFPGFFEALRALRAQSPR